METIIKSEGAGNYASPKKNGVKYLQCIFPIMKQRKIFLIFILDELLLGAVVIFLIHYFTSWNLWTMGIILLALGMLLTFMLYVFIPQFRAPQTGKEGMIGLSGTALTPLTPQGQVKINGKIWVARSIGDNIEKGCRIEIVDIEGIVVLVKEIPQ